MYWRTKFFLLLRKANLWIFKSLIYSLENWWMSGWGEHYIVLAAPYLVKIHMMCVLYNSDMRTVFFMYTVARQDFSVD